MVEQGAKYKAGVRKRHQEVYLWAFRELAYKYLGLTEESLKFKLSNEELKELIDLIYEKAKHRLWLKKLWRIVLGIAIPIFGWIYLFKVFLLTSEAFPDLKFYSLHLWWYEQNFFPISQNALSINRGEER